MVKKRYVFYMLGGLALLLTLILATVCYWVMATPAGSAWLVRTLAGQAPETFAVGSVEGRLIDDLVLRRVELRWDESRAIIDRLTLRWRIGGLLRPRVRIRALHLEDITLITAGEGEETTEPPELSWPQPPGWLQRLRIRVEDLQVRRLTWQRPDAAPLYLEGLVAEVRWSRRLSIPWLTLLSDQGALTARAVLDWKRPRLQVQGTAWLKPSADTDLPLVMALRLQPGTGAPTLRGELRAGGHLAATGGLQLAAPFSLTATGVQVSDFHLQSLSASGLLQGRAQLDWSTDEPRGELAATLRDWNLAPQTGRPTSLSGKLDLNGSLQRFTGHLNLANQAADWQNLQLESDFDGDRRQLHLTQLKIAGLDGTLAGAIDLQWAPQLQIRGNLGGRGLNPQAAGLAWPGNINLQAEGSWSRPDQGEATAALQATLLPSTLRGHPLRGRAEARLQGRELTVEALELHGRGVDLAARGRLRDRIDFTAEVDDLAGLVPGLGGAVQGQGWVRWRDERLAGRVTGSGRGLQRQQLRLERLRFSAALAADRSLSLDARLTGLDHDSLRIPALALQADGRPERHDLSLSLTLPRQGRLALAATGGYAASRWQGRLTALTLEDAVGTLRLDRPVALTLSPEQLECDTLRLTGRSGEQLSARARVAFSPLRGQAELNWQALRLAHGQPWLQNASISGTSDGTISWRLSGNDNFAIAANLRASGRFEQERLELDFSSAEADLNWDQSALRAAFNVALRDGGRLEGSILGGSSARPALPEQASLQLALSELSLQRLTPWLPEDIRAQGVLSGQGAGELLRDGALSATGRLTVREGQLQTGREQGRITVPMRTAELSWAWSGRQLSGRTELQLGDYGRLEGRFQLPVPARLPVRPEPEGELDMALSGRSTELGLLTALMPGAVQESRGRVEISLRGAGSWRQPRLSGQVRLLDAGAYLPIAGIELRDVGFSARLDNDRILLDKLSLRSGQGTLQGSGSLLLRDWRPGDYQLTLQGEKVQVVNLPELQVVANPDLRFTGTPEGVKVTGSILLPEVLVRDIERPSVVTPSEDVIIVDRPQPVKTGPDFHIEADVRLQLGDHVLIDVAGLDARLTGELRLTAIGADSLNAEGRISVAEGRYAAYGTRLDITRGNLLFNGPVDQPTLDILALRTVGKVKAGVQVSGTPRTPVVRLTSEPAMSDSDRLAYIVLGRASARNAGEADLLMAAGGALLSQGESVVLRDRLKRQLGLDVLGFEAAGGATDDVTGSMLTLGKYLSPSLYVSIGQSLFSDTQQFRLRYSISDHWELESTTGEESGVDLYYKIEFR